MPPNRLPIVDSDDGVWGDILRQYLMQEHVNDDTDNPLNGGHKTITIQPGTTAAGTAPLKFSSGSLLTTPEAGAIEFLSDTLYFTDSSGPTRRAIATYPVSGGAEGDIYYRNGSGAFTRLAVGGNGDVLTVNSGVPSWETPVENTTFQDDTFTLQDSGDNTKQARFELSSISTATTRTYTLPNSNTTLVGTGVAQTLTNKTLTSPRVNNLLDTNGNTVLNFSPVASADNYVTIHNNDGGWVGAQANGAATDIPFFIYPKGDGGLVLFTQAGETPTIKADGIDANLNLNLLAKGTGTVQVDGVDVTTETNTQTLTNKTIDGGDNTLQNIPQSAITDLDTDMAGKLDSVDHTTKARGGSNIAFNPDFEDTSAGRTNYGSPIAPGYSTEQAHSGTHSWKWTTPTIGSTSGIQFDPSDPSITSNVSVRVQPGDKYYISAWVYSHASNNHGSGGALQFTARFVDSTGSLSNSYQSETINLSSVPLSQWTKLHVSLDTPAGYDQVVVFFTATNSTPQGNIYYIDDLVWQPVSTYHQGAELELFKTKDEETNYEKARHYWNSNIYTIATENGGTGVARSMSLTANGKSLHIGASNAWFEFASSTTVATSIAGITGSWGQNSGMTYGMSITPAVGQSGTAGYTALLVNPSHSATGSGIKLLADFQLGGSSKVSIDTTGVITVAAAGTGAGSVATVDGTQTLTNKTLTGPRVDQLNDTNGNNVLDLVAIGSAVNQFYITNQSTGNYPTLGVDGSDTNIGFTLAPKGNGPVRIYASAGQTPKIDVAGPDANLNLNLIPKGTGVVQAGGVEVATISGAQTLTNKTLTGPRVDQINDTNGNASIYIAATASAVNYVNITNTATGSGPAIFPMGSDTDIQLRLRGKGTGGVVVYDGTDTSKRVKFDISNLTTSSIRTINFPDANATLVGTDTAQTLTNKTLTAPKIASGGYIADANGNEQIVFNTTASAVNHITLTNAAAGGNPVIAATGDDTNLHLILRAKGTGAVALQGNGQNVLYTNGVVSAVNYVTMTNSATGNAVVIGTYGTDTNVNLNLAPKGAGIVQVDGIEVATISSSQILTNKTIDGGDNTITNLDASSITSGSFSRDQIGIPDFDNLVAGSDFEKDDQPWTIGTNWAIASDQAYTGTYSIKCTAGGGGTSTLKGAIAVREGERFYVEFWARRDSLWNGTTGNSKLRFSDADDNTHFNSVSYGSTEIPLADTWTFMSGVITIPAGHQRMQIQLRNDASAGHLWVDDIVVRRVAGTFNDNDFLLRDNGDITRQAEFSLGDITPGQKRILTLPDANTTLVGINTTQTLTNKTIDASNNTITNLDLADFAASAIITESEGISGNDNDTTIPTSAAVKDYVDNAGTTTFTDDTFTVQDNGDNTKQLRFQLSGLTTSTTRTLTVPDASTTIVGTDATQTLTNKTVEVQDLTDLYTVAPSNKNYMMTDNAGQYPAFNPVSKYLWHDLLRFNRWFSTPTYETYNGSWSPQTLNSMLFNGKEAQSLQVADGSTITAVRWTWNSGNVSWSNISWWVIGFTYDAGGQTNNVVIESSSNGVDWTTRHDSVTTASARPVWFSQAPHSGDSYIRLTITSTSGQVIELSSIRALSTRWGDQGGGSENELPYRWDNSANITIGTNNERSDGVLNIGGTSATTSAEGIFFGNDTNLYRSASSTLRTDDKLVVAPPSGNPGVVINRASGQPSLQADSSDGFLIMDSSGSQLRLNNYVSDHVSIASGGGRVGIGTSNITNTGRLELAASTSATEGISFGGDTNLYRSAADTLRTDDTLIVGTPGTSTGSVVTIDGTQTLTNKTIDASANTITNLDLADFAASAIVTEGEGISSNDNDTTVPTSAAVKDYADGLIGNQQAKFKTGTVATAAGTAAKTVTLDAPWASHTPVAGDYFLITFTSGQSVSSPTLNINSSGASAIRTPQNQTNSANTAVTSGGTVLLYYDGTTYVLPGATQNTTYSTISDAEIINTGSTTARLITGQRAETLMANEASVSRTLSNKTLSSGIISGTTELTGSINFTPDSGTVLSFDGDPVITRYAGGNNKSIGIGADDAVFIAAGETRGQLDANIVIDAADETVYLAGESGIKVIASPDNWNSNWAGRVETVIDASGITWDGNEVWHAGNDGAGSGLDADTLDGQQASAFASASHTHTATEISDSTSVGRSVLTAANASAARSAIGAGTGDMSSNEFIHHARGGSNIIIGPDFESTAITRALYASPSSSGYTTDESRSGARSWYWTTPGSTTVGLYLSATDSSTGYISTRPGDIFYMEAWVLSHASNSFSTGSINLTVRIVDSTGTLANSYASDNISTSSLSVATWHKLSTYFTVPAGYDQLYLFVTSSDTVPSGETYYIDDVLLREVTDAQTAIQALYGSSTVSSTIQTSAVPDLSASKITSGTLSVSRGGTGATSLSGVVIGNGTGAFTTVTAPSGAIVGTSDAQTLTNKTFSDGLKVGDNSAPVVLEIAGPNSSTAGATLTFSENSGTPKNGVSLRYNSSSNFLELVDDVGDNIRVIFDRSGGVGFQNHGLTAVGSINSLSIPSSNFVGLTDAQALTNKDMTSGTNTWPTFNQNTTGSAATLTTARTFRTNLSSTSTASFNGSANVTPGVQGTLGVGNGGTGATTLSGIVVGNGTSPFTTVAAPSGAIVGTSDAQTLTNKTLTSPTINGNTSINGDLTIDNGTNSIISVISDDGGVSGIELYGSSQGTGYVEVGQSTTHGGGMYYNGDGTPSFASGEANDTIGFYRKSASVRSEVFYYAHNSDDVFFNGAISTTDGTFTGTIQTDAIKSRTNQQLVLNVGESHNQATGQTGESLYVNAEAGLEVNASPDNWGSAWAGRVTTTINASGITWNGNTVWHAGNDGAGSGLDADTLDGQQASAFASASHTHVATDISNSTSVGRSVLTAASASAARSAIGAGTGDGDVTLSGVQTLSNKTVNDNSFAIQDNSDNSKKMEFSLDGMTTSSTITLQAPNVTSGNHTLVVRNSTDVLKNKRIEPRVTTVASSATPSFNTDSTDLLDITALATNITSMTSSMSGTPTNGEKILIRIKDNGTPRSITWGASWRGIGVSLPIVTTASKTLYIGANYNANDSIWDVIAVEQEA